jgi:hypothetical protein
MRTHALACGKLRELGLFKPEHRQSIKMWMHPSKDMVCRTLAQACYSFSPPPTFSPFSPLQLIFSSNLPFTFVERPITRRLLEDCCGVVLPL